MEEKYVLKTKGNSIKNVKERAVNWLRFLS